MEWKNINAAPFQKLRHLTRNIATTHAIRCAATSGLAYRHVAYLAAAFLGFLRCHPRRWFKTVTVSPCWKIFSTVFANSLYYQRAISDGSTVIGGVNNRPCCATGGPVLTWAFDGTARTKIVPPVAFPKENPSTSSSPCQWTYADGSGRRPGRFSGELEIDPVRYRSPTEANQKLPQPGG